MDTLSPAIIFMINAYVGGLFETYAPYCSFQYLMISFDCECGGRELSI
jgi:hypothetical protein